MKAAYAPMGVVALGVALLALSWLWPSLAGGAAAFSEQDRQAFEQARTNLLDTMHGHKAADSGDEDRQQSQQAAQAAFDAARERRDAAFAKGQSTAAVLRWTGVVVVLLGATAHFALRTQ